MKTRTIGLTAPPAWLSLACILALGATACGDLLGFDGKSGGADDAGGLSIVDAGVEDAAAPDTGVEDAAAPDTGIGNPAPPDAGIGDAAAPDAEAGAKTPTVTGTFVSGGASLSGSTRIRGQFSWAPGHVVTNGSVTVSGGFH